MLMAGTLRAEANLAMANGLFLLLLFLGGMAYPLAKLPNAIEAVARLLPAAALAETVRGALAVHTHIPMGELAVLARVGDCRAAGRRALVPLGGVTRGRLADQVPARAMMRSASDLNFAALSSPKNRATIFPFRSTKNVCGSERTP